MQQHTFQVFVKEGGYHYIDVETSESIAEAALDAEEHVRDVWNETPIESMTRYVGTQEL